MSFESRSRIPVDVDMKTRKLYALSLLDERLRTRLLFELRHITTRLDFLEPYLLTKLTDSSTMINEDHLKEFSSAEIGYDITKYINVYEMEVIRIADNGNKMPDDYVLFDLIEIIIIFAKKTMRDEIVKRLNDIFAEQNSDFKIQEWMINIRGKGTLSDYASLLKDDILKAKIQSHNSLTGETLTHQALASNSAGALQFIFSGNSQKDTKKMSEDIIGKISKEWTTEENAPKLEEIINNLVKLAKDMSNQISNIRHTDRNTIQTNGQAMYELIYKLNMALVKLSIDSDPTKYFENRKAEDIKTDYSNRYSVDLSVYDNATEVDDNQPLDLSTIPF